MRISRSYLTQKDVLEPLIERSGPEVRNKLWRICTTTQREVEVRMSSVKYQTSPATRAADRLFLAVNHHLERAPIIRMRDFFNPKINRFLPLLACTLGVALVGLAVSFVVYPILAGQFYRLGISLGIKGLQWLENMDLSDALFNRAHALLSNILWLGLNSIGLKIIISSNAAQDSKALQAAKFVARSIFSYQVFKSILVITRIAGQMLEVATYSPTSLIPLGSCCFRALAKQGHHLVLALSFFSLRNKFFQFCKTTYQNWKTDRVVQWQTQVIDDLNQTFAPTSPKIQFPVLTWGFSNEMPARITVTSGLYTLFLDKPSHNSLRIQSQDRAYLLSSNSSLKDMLPLTNWFLQVDPSLARTLPGACPASVRDAEALAELRMNSKEYADLEE